MGCAEQFISKIVDTTKPPCTKMRRDPSAAMRDGELRGRLDDVSRMFDLHSITNGDPFGGNFARF